MTDESMNPIKHESKGQLEFDTFCDTWYGYKDFVDLLMTRRRSDI